MTRDLARRDFLKASAVFAGAAATSAFSCVEIASAAPIEVPTVDKLSIRVLVDSSYDQFFRPKQANGVSIAPPRVAPISARRCTMSGACRSGWNRSAGSAAHADAGLRLYAGSAHQQHGAGRRRSREDRRADRQPRPLRSFRRPSSVPRQVPQHAAGRPQALCRRRGQFLPSRQRDADQGPVHRLRHARPPRARGAEGHDRAVRNPDRDRRPCLHHRQDQAQSIEKCCRTPWSNSG